MGERGGRSTGAELIRAPPAPGAFDGIFGFSSGRPGMCPHRHMAGEQLRLTWDLHRAAWGITGPLLVKVAWLH